MWVKIKRNEDGTYRISGSKGVVIGPLKDLLEIGEINEDQIWKILNKSLNQKKIGQTKYNLIVTELVVEVI